MQRLTIATLRLLRPGQFNAGHVLAPYTRSSCCPPNLFMSGQRLFSGESRKDPEEICRATFTEEIKVYMPEMGEGEGRVVKWYKQEGEIVLKDDFLCDIETKDFSFGMVTDDDCDAIMGKILIDANSEPVKEKSVICTLFHAKNEDEKEEETKSV